jgi:hypothetical protein
MKYLYKILRLFFCPHRWDIKNTEKMELIDGDDTIVKDYTKFTLQCRYCGNLKTQTS